MGRRPIAGLETHLTQVEVLSEGVARRRVVRRQALLHRGLARRAPASDRRALLSRRAAPEQQTEHRSGGRLASGRARVRAERATTPGIAPGTGAAQGARCYAIRPIPRPAA